MERPIFRIRHVSESMADRRQALTSWLRPAARNKISRRRDALSALRRSASRPAALLRLAATISDGENTVAQRRGEGGDGDCSNVSPNTQARYDLLGSGITTREAKSQPHPR